MGGLREDFAALVAAGERTDLARAALAIARIAYPDLDPAPYLRQLDGLAAAVRPRLYPQASPEAAVTELAGYLFDECGFRGNQEEYYDPRNSYLNDVLERRTGIPITLSLVLIETGVRLGLGIEGVGFPGHFLVRVAGSRGPLLLDPFYGGRPIGERELLARYRTFVGSDAPALPPAASRHHDPVRHRPGRDHPPRAALAHRHLVQEDLVVPPPGARLGRHLGARRRVVAHVDADGRGLVAEVEAGDRPRRHRAGGVEERGERALVDRAVAVGLVGRERHVDDRVAVLHARDREPEARHERHRHDGAREPRHLAAGGRGLGARHALPLGTRRRVVERAVGDQALRDALAAVVAHVHVGIGDLLAAPEDLGLGHDVLADGGGQVVDGEVERAGVEDGPAGEPRRGGEHARDVDGGGGHAAVQRSSGVRVLVLVRDAEARAVERDRLHHDAEPGAVGGLGDAGGEGGERVSHRRPPCRRRPPVC